MASNNDPKSWHRTTCLVHGGIQRSQFQETSEALFLTSGYVYDTASDAEDAFKDELDHYIYSRFSNPTVYAFEQRLALLEGANFCRATATGMAAINGLLMALVNTKDRIVASRALFGSCVYILNEIMPRFDIHVEWVDAAAMDQWEKALAKPTKAVLIETPSNPGLEIIDLKAVAKLCKDTGAKLIVDNVFATPILQRPLDYGADYVVYSATKHIDGQGRCLGGAILTNDAQFMDERLSPDLRNTGPTLSPFNAWILIKGLETLNLRVEHMCNNALMLAQILERKPGISKVYYPGLPSHPQHKLAMAQMENRGGSIITFEVDGGKEAAFKLLNSLKLINISNNLGDAKSLITHPATTTHQRLSDEEKFRVGITPGLVRLSVGLEDVNDLAKDLDLAMRG